MPKKTDELETQVRKLERARDMMARVMVKQFGGDETLARLVAADAIRQLLAPTRAQLLRAWARRWRRALVWGTLAPVLLASIVFLFVLGISSLPSTYPRTYAVSDTWRPSPRIGFFDGSPKVDSEGGICFVKDRRDGRDCVAPSMLSEISAAVSEAMQQGRQGKVWEGPNGNGEQWVIEHTGKRLTVTATRTK